MLRRYVMSLACLTVLITGVGLGGAGAAAAAATSTRQVNMVKPGQKWTMERHEATGSGYGWCEVITFGSSDTWTADLDGDKGTYTGGKTAITMTWTAGSDSPLTFTGTLKKAKPKKFKGKFSKAPTVGKLIKGTKPHDSSGTSC